MLAASGAPCYRARWVATSAGELSIERSSGAFLEAPDHLGRKQGLVSAIAARKSSVDGASLNLIEVLSLKRS